MRASFAVTLLVTAALAASARATSVPRLTPAQVAARSDVVVEGLIIARESAWVGRKIYTFVTVRVDAVLRGALSQAERDAGTVVVAVPGGVVGAIGQRVPGAPVLLDGARYAVCLSHATGPVIAGEHARGVMYFHQGLWRVDGSVAPERVREIEALLRGDAP